MKDPWTWTRVWGLTKEVGAGWVDGGGGDKIGTSIRAKIILKINNMNRKYIVYF